MIDFHTHTLWSDGELLPTELARRAEYLGYKALAITDHADFSNLEILIPRICNVCQKLRGSLNIQIIPGVELTHLPPGDIAQAAKEARLLGAQIVVVHGETIVEPVMPGTNLRALESEIDILAHPGLITKDEIKLAKARGIYLELTTRKGHSFTNGHVAQCAIKYGARLILNTDSHSPSDLIDLSFAQKLLLVLAYRKQNFCL
jgi:histidinol phosphatase-like PHP family hydrolase